MIAKRTQLIFSFFYMFICSSIFYLIFRRQVPTDIQLHIDILEKYIKHGYFPNPPLFYLAINDIAFIFKNNFIYAAIVVLTAASFLKYWLVNKYLITDTHYSHSFFISLMVFSLMFMSPIFIYHFDGNQLYLGKFTSSIWHNSTTIFVFPFSIWLYIESVNYINNPRKIQLLKMLALSIIILLAKPSFLFAFIPVYPIICLVKFKLHNKWFWYALLVCLISFFGLIIQKYLIYQNNNLDQLVYSGEESKIIIAPFKVWLLWARHPILNLFSSFLFIGTATAFFYKTLLKDKEFQYAFLLLLVSIGVFFIMAESGPRLKHGNFFWQVPIAMLIMEMFLVKKIVLPYWIISAKNNSLVLNSTKSKILLFIFSLHFISGIYYIIKLFLLKSFY